MHALYNQSSGVRMKKKEKRNTGSSAKKKIGKNTNECMRG